MAIILNNGANLPDIPEGVLDERPYAVVCQSIADPTTYTLMVSSWEVFCVPASITGYTCIAPWADQMNYWYHQGTDSDWNSPEYTKPLAAAEYTIVWANHDVYNATALESNTLIPGDIYFSKSESPKSGIVIDGITLPEFPADMLAKYPHVLIAMYDVGIYEAVLSKTPVYAVFSDSEHMGYAATENGHATFGIKVPEDSNWTCYSTNDSEMFFTNSVFPLSWTNYDVLVADYTTGEPTSEIFFRNCEAPKSGIVIDGIELPAFPEGFLDETNKYCTVFYMDFGDMEGVPDDETTPPMYMAIASSSPAFYVPKELNSLNGNAFGMIAIICDVATTMTMYEVGATGTWENPIPYLKEMGFAVENIEAAGLLATPKWANYDIKTATQFTKTDEPYTVGDEIYFPNSEVPPEYLSEQYSWFVSLGDIVRSRGYQGLCTLDSVKESFESSIPCTVMDKNSIMINKNVAAVRLPTLPALMPFAFNNFKNLRYIDLGETSVIYNWSIVNCYELNTVILRSPTVVSVKRLSSVINPFDALHGTDVSSKYDEGYLYVPAALVDSYKSNSSWSHLKDYIRAIEDYPNICGVR